MSLNTHTNVKKKNGDHQSVLTIRKIITVIITVIIDMDIFTHVQKVVTIYMCAI